MSKMKLGRLGPAAPKLRMVAVETKLSPMGSPRSSCWVFRTVSTLAGTAMKTSLDTLELSWSLVEVSMFRKVSLVVPIVRVGRGQVGQRTAGLRRMEDHVPTVVEQQPWRPRTQPRSFSNA